MEEKVNMNDDSIKLLRECEAGIKMGISAIDDVIDDAQDKKLKSMHVGLQQCGVRLIPSCSINGFQGL